MIRDLAHVVEREEAQIGLLVTLAEPTAPMRKEAASAGFYTSPALNRSFPKIQILTVDDLLLNKVSPIYPDMTRGGLTFKKAKREKGKDKQDGFLF